MWLASKRWDQPHLIASKEVVSSSYNCKDLNFANNENELVSIFSPGAFRQEVSLANALISALLCPEQRTQSCCAGLLTYKNWHNKMDIDLSHSVCSSLLSSNKNLIHSSFISWKSLCITAIISSVTVWSNSPVKPCGHGVFFVGKF